MSHGSSVLDLCASAIGTCVAELITLPICTIKTNYQTNLQYKSIIDVGKDIMRTRGLYGFYSASMAATVLQIVSTSTKFTFYNYFRDYRVTAQNDIKNNIVNGALGGIVSSLLMHPIDVIKIHQQNNLSIIQEFKKTGARLWYRGYSKTLAKSVGVTSLLFPLNDFYKSIFVSTAFAAGLSAFTVTAVIHPLDYLKVRHIANQDLYPKIHNMSTFLKYYYRGVHINLMRVVPHFMITMTLIEKLKLYLK